MDYANDIALLANTPAQAESLLHCLERAAGSISLNVNADNTEYMCFNQSGKGWALKLVDKFTYLRISVSSTENDINKHLAKAWTAINRLSVIWKSDLTDKIKRSFFQAAIVMEKKLVGNYTRMLQAVFNKSWRQYPTKQQLYGHQPPIT